MVSHSPRPLGGGPSEEQCILFSTLAVSLWMVPLLSSHLVLQALLQSKITLALGLQEPTFLHVSPLLAVLGPAWGLRKPSPMTTRVC